jgi:hypothetical protein
MKYSFETLNSQIMKYAFYSLIFLTLLNNLSAERFAKIIYYQASKEAPKEVYISQNSVTAKNLEEVKNGQEVAFKHNRFSKSFELQKGALRLTFLPKDHLADDIPDGSPRVNIKKEWSNVILLVSEDKDNLVMPIKVIAFDASDKVFSPGSIMFVNQTDIIVGGLVAGEELKMKSNSYKIIDIPKNERIEFNLILDSYNAKTKQRRNLLRKRWLHIPQFRNVVFVTKLPPPRMAKCFVAEIRKF